MVSLLCALQFAHVIAINMEILYILLLYYRFLSMKLDCMEQLEKVTILGKCVIPSKELVTMAAHMQ